MGSESPLISLTVVSLNSKRGLVMIFAYVACCGTTLLITLEFDTTPSSTSRRVYLNDMPTDAPYKVLGRRRR
jgi:hypothetical protein